jgi:cell division septation protein DedD
MFARLALFLGLGFAAGLFFGVVTKEPGLLAGHLQSDSRSYPLAEAPDEDAPEEPAIQGTEPESIAGEGRPLETARRLEAEREGRSGVPESADIVANPSLRDSDRQAERLALGRSSETARPLPEVAAPSREVARSAGSTSAARAAATSEGLWAIQVGAFSDRRTAEGLVRSLRAKDYPADLVIPDDSRSASQAVNRWRVRVQPLENRSRADALADQLKQREGLPTWLIPFEAREPR